MQVMVDADLAKCSGTAMEGPWKLSSLTSLIPEATAGGDKFAGLDAMIDPMMNRSPGWIKFARGTLTCEVEYGDGDAANTPTFETPDGVPAVDTRVYTGGTLIVEEKTAPTRTFVVTGRAVLKYITPDQTFAASWTLKSPPSATSATVDDDAVDITDTGDVSVAIGSVFSSKDRLSTNERRSPDRDGTRGGAQVGLPPFFFQSNLPASGFALPTGLRPFQTFGIFPNEPLRRRADGPPAWSTGPLLAPGREFPRE